MSIEATAISEFADSLRQASGVDVNNCYQCRKCVSGCPVAYAMDFTPAQLLHATRLGLKDLVLRSATIWLCASCETCVTRCPQEVDLVKVMDALRVMALRAGIKPAVPEVASFYRAYLLNLRYLGRMHDLTLIAQLKLSTRQFGKDLNLGIEMLKRRKLKLLPDGGGFGKATRIFSRVGKVEAG